jgi:hypothetical protein
MGSGARCPRSGSALFAVGGAHPFWALGVFALCLIVIHGLVVYGEELDRTIDRT